MGRAGTQFKIGLMALAVFGLVAAGFSTARAAQKSEGADALAKLEKVDVKSEGGSTTIVVVLDKAVTFSAMRLTDPPKLVLDLEGADTAGVVGTMNVDKDPVAYITPANVYETKRAARLEIGLTKASNSKIIKSGNTITVTFENRQAPVVEAKKEVLVAPPSVEAAPKAVPEAAKAVPAAPLVAAAKPAVEVKEAAKPAVQEAKAPEQKPQAKPVEAKFKPATMVEGITCVKSGTGYQVTIAGNGAVTGQKVFMLGKDRLVVDLEGVGSLKSKVEVEVGQETLKKVRMAAHDDKQKKVRVVLDLSGEVDYDVKAMGKGLVVTVAPRGALARATEVAPEKAVKEAKKPEAEAKRVVTVSKTAAPAQTAPALKPEGKLYASAATPVITAPAAVQDAQAGKPARLNVYLSKKDGKAVLSSAPVDIGSGEKFEDKSLNYVETETKIYTGGRISFDIQDADLDKVIKLLADVAGLNLILDPKEVTGKITLKLDKVPWDQALDIILRIYNLDKVIEGNVLRVAPKAKFESEQKRDLEQDKDMDRLKYENEQLYTKIFKVNYITVDDEFNNKVRSYLSPRGDSQYNAQTNELIVTDVKDYKGKGLEKAEAIIKNQDQPRKQVMIEARIVTVDTSYTRSLGISWGLTRKSGSTNPNFGFTSGGASAGNTGFKGEVIPNGPNGSNSYQLNIPTALAAAGNLSGGILGSMSWGNLLKDVNLDLTVQALETINKAETISAPKLMTVDGEEAKIISGQTIYVLVNSSKGSDYKELRGGLNMSVTPRISGDYIRLDVDVGNNEYNQQAQGANPTINERSVKTHVMVKDGDTVVLGGTFIGGKTQNEGRVPLLGRIPIIGWLFKSQNYQVPNQELLIFITPKVISQPIAQQA